MLEVIKLKEGCSCGVKMTCPECGERMNYVSFYGELKRAEHYYTYPQLTEWVGDIFKCDNETCKAYGKNFYTGEMGILVEGYPC